MKKILLLSLVGLCAGSLNAQTTLYNQTFTTDAADAAAVTAAYIRNDNTTPKINLGDNMFTKLGSVNPTSSATSVSVAGGKVSLMRTGAFTALAGSNDYTLVAARTASGASNNTNARLVLNSPQAMKVSMDITVKDFQAYVATHAESGSASNINGMINAVLLFVGGDALNQNGSDNPANTTNAHSALAITTSADGSTFRFSRPAGFGNPGSGADANLTATYAKGSTVTLTWYINNSNSSMNYTDPEGNAQTLGNDQWDLFVKQGAGPHTLILDDRTALATGASANINNMALQVRPLVGYSSNSANSTSWVQNPITVEIANWLVQDITSIVTLPVKLDRFTGLATTIGNEISWRTGSETNNSHFEVLRAADGINFVKIGKVSGKGTTAGFTNYTFIDRNPLKGTNYYMLKQFDLDGTANDYSPIAVRALDRDEQFTIFVKENGEVEVLYFAEEADNNTSLKIFDLNGRVLVNKTLSIVKGYNKIALTATLPNGLLVGAIKSGQQSSSIKFLK